MARRRAKLIRNRIKTFGIVQYISGTTHHRSYIKKKIFAPDTISFARNEKITVEFLRHIRKQIDNFRSTKIQLVIDLSPSKDISIACALCIVAEFDRWQRRIGKSLLPTTIHQWDKEVVRLLAELGFFALLKTKIPRELKIPGPNAKIYIPFITSAIADTALAARFRESVGEPLRERSRVALDLYRSLGEAISNAVEHAYPNDATTLAERHWWLTGSIDHENRRLSVVVLDHGIGIPGSLPRSRHLKEIMDAVNRFFGGESDDGKLIEAAMEVGRSRLKQPQRGKGLGDVLKLAMADPTNRLRVISGRGCYVYENGRASSRVMEGGLDGTLIEWDLAFPSGPEEEEA